MVKSPSTTWTTQLLTVDATLYVRSMCATAHNKPYEVSYTHASTYTSYADSVSVLLPSDTAYQRHIAQHVPSTFDKCT